ncbi:IS481 family transposase [Herbiconiux sp. 11R-BC]|uniref:IS481 family transposase n=1 Tax=Herbiconiux sp. 11R-BC TaxID=3111637 RepID=UPI003C01A9E5
MSKARLIITAVLIQGRPQSEVAREYAVSKSWVSKLVARYRLEGAAAFEPHSRKPRTSPTAISDETRTRILALRDQLTAEGLDSGAHTIAWHLQHHHDTAVSPATIWRTLRRAGAITPQPQKRPRSSWIRFEAALPNETWQSDFTHYRLADGTDTEILTFLDDCTRYAVGITAHPSVTTSAILTAFRAAARVHGIPASTLTDNGMVFTVRLAGHGRRGGRNAFENELRELGIDQRNGSPNHPQTQGKVERFQQTMKNWLRARPDQPDNIEQLQHLLDLFADEYNNRRPHRSLPHHATPAARYQALPKAAPSPDSHSRIRHDRIDKTGSVTLRLASRLHHIGIGRTHAGTHVLMLVDDHDVTVINATTGELLRQLTIDPTHDYQPQKTEKPPNQ